MLDNRGRIGKAAHRNAKKLKKLATHSRLASLLHAALAHYSALFHAVILEKVMGEEVVRPDALRIHLDGLLKIRDRRLIDAIPEDAAGN